MAVYSTLEYNMKTELKEVVTKKGRRLVFCDLEELLMEFYGCTIPEQLEQYKNPNGEYIIHCPFCRDEGHRKHKLYINMDLGQGFCFTCDRVYIHTTEDINLDLRVPETLINFGCRKGTFKLSSLPDNQEWNLDKYNYEADDDDDLAMRYLMGRHKYMGELSKAVGLRYIDHNIMIPFPLYGNGDVFYYQIRFNGATKIRYYLPPLGPGGQKPVYCIRKKNEDRGDRVIVVEGPFDLYAAMIMAPSAIPVAVLGSHISEYQLDYMKQFLNPKHILVYLDETKLSRGIADRLKGAFDTARIDIVPSDGTDPEEKMKEIMAKHPGKEIGWLERYWDYKPRTWGFKIPEFV